MAIKICSEERDGAINTFPCPDQGGSNWSFGQEDLKDWFAISGGLVSDVLRFIGGSRNPNGNTTNNNAGNGNNGNGGNSGNGGNNNGTDWSLFIIIGFVVLVLAVLVFLIIKASK